jgi:ion channel-forming bestrophin family protein
MIKWTRKDTYKFIIIAIIPVFLYAIVGLKWLHLPWLPIALIGTAVAFLVSFKNNASYDRLWEARKIWGGIINASRSFAMILNSHIINQNGQTTSQNELQAIKRKLVIRHVAWLTSHRYALRKIKPWEMFMDKLTNQEYATYYDVHEWNQTFDEAIKPYLSENEFAEIQGKRNISTQILGMQSTELRRLKEQGLIWEFSHLEMEQQLVDLTALQGKNERIKNFPYPRQFATLNLFFVWIFILLLPFGIMSEFDQIGLKLLQSHEPLATGFIDTVYLFVAKHFIWFSIPFSSAISWIFHTMERIGEVSENPFEGTANDVPITTMSRDIEIDMLEIIGETETPDSIPEVYDIQM